ncbi:EndoU domain-containing protein [Streptomyces sp. NBC_00433]
MTLVQDVASGIDNGVWSDGSSATAKRMLQEFSDELGVARQAFGEAADSLNAVASLVGAHRARHQEVVAQLRAAGHAPVHSVFDAAGSTAHLAHEKQQIEREITAAMAHAAHTVRSATARATRHPRSTWSRIGDFLHGVWDGTYAMGKSLVELASLAARLNPERIAYDPVGYAQDMQKIVGAEARMVGALLRDPAGFGRTVLSSALDLDDLKKNPAHWAGALVPTVLGTVLTDGEGAVLKGVNATKGVEATAKMTNGLLASDDFKFSSTAFNHIVNGEINKGGRAVGFHSAPDGVAPPGREIVSIREVYPDGTYRADVKVNGVRKRADLHTMYPDSWSHDDIRSAIETAFANRVEYDGGMWIGHHGDMQITGYVRDGQPVTAFPTTYGPSSGTSR